MSQKAPPEIVDRVIRLYVEGKSDEEIQESIGLSGDKLYEIIYGLGSSENLNQLAFHLAVQIGKDGKDVKDKLHLLEDKWCPMSPYWPDEEEAEAYFLVALRSISANCSSVIMRSSLRNFFISL